MSKTIPYIKLDWDWRDDEKVALLRERHGHKAEFAWVQMAITMASCGGLVRLDDPAHMAAAKRFLRTSDANVRRFCDWFAECGLINPGLYAQHAHVTSARAASEQRAREGRSEFAMWLRANGGNSGKPAKAQSDRPKSDGKRTGAASISGVISGMFPAAQS